MLIFLGGRAWEWEGRRPMWVGLDAGWGRVGGLEVQRLYTWDAPWREGRAEVDVVSLTGEATLTAIGAPPRMLRPPEGMLRFDF